MSKMGLHDSFGHLKHKLWPKGRPKVKLAVWFPTTKSRESTRLPCVQVMCDIPLKISRRGLQLCFRTHLNRKSAHKVVGPQNRESPNFENFEIPRTKCHLDVGLMERHVVYYKGEGGGFSQVRAVMSLASPSLPVACLNTKNVQTMH
jgi:hypothetical protein